MNRLPLLLCCVLAATWGTACNKHSEPRAKTEAEAEVALAASEVDRKVKTAAAQAEFAELRNEYRRRVEAKLGELDRRVSQLEDKAQRASGAQKAELMACLKQIHESRAAFNRESRSIETVSVWGWAETKSRLDRSWSALIALVEKA